MNILVVGRGGREHSIIMKLKESDRVTKLYAAPGNGGIAQEATCIPIDEMDTEGLIAFAKKETIDLTIVGPENPLKQWNCQCIFSEKVYEYLHLQRKLLY
jgi:phosphoribosylamine---glycine ligase